jgi:hypothetical protein
MNRTTAVLGAFAVSAILAVMPTATAQERSQGVSVHMLPKRVANLGRKPWGFTVDYSPRLKPEPQSPVIQTAAELISYLRKQSPQVQENGIWIVTTSPEAYSEEEKTLLEDVKSMCRSERIALFICRASQLPNGWVRADK